MIAVKVPGALADALWNEHCHAECGSACDICTAYSNSLFGWAAHLLIGATECPKVVRALRAERWTRALLEQERLELLKLPWLRCQKCNGINREVRWGDRCGDCLTCFVQDRVGYYTNTENVWCRSCLAEPRCQYPGFESVRARRIVEPGLEEWCPGCQLHFETTEYTLAKAVEDQQLGRIVSCPGKGQ
jgi:hypothetical protein